MVPLRAAGNGQQFSFGRYETIFRIGSGGMAEVFAARLSGEAGFERLVAIKRLLPHLAEDPQYVTRFLDEGRLAARVVHPHVVQTLDLGRNDEGDPFLVLELIVGSTLERLIRVEPLPPISVTLTWLSQAAEGLHAAHTARAPDGQSLGLVHRDVSPHNILVGCDGDARIGDFGIAHATQLKMARTPTGQVTGKFAYFSPEQVRGLPLDARSDLFSLGVVAWEALVGRPLFHASTPAETFDRVRTLEVPPPHKLRSGIPARASEVVLAALARDRDARTPDALSFARELSALVHALGDIPSSTERARWVRTNADGMWQQLGSNVQSTVAPRASTRARPAARRGLWAALALSLLLAISWSLLKNASTLGGMPGSANLPRAEADDRLRASTHVPPSPAQKPPMSISPMAPTAEPPRPALAAQAAIEPGRTPEPVRPAGRAQRAGASLRNVRPKRTIDSPAQSATSGVDVAEPSPAALVRQPLLGTDAFERNLSRQDAAKLDDGSGRL